MRTTQIGLTLLLVALSAPALSAEPGTAAAAANARIVDAATGESWSRVTATAPSTWTLTGPGRFQVGFRLNLPPDEAVPAGIVMVRHQGKPLAQFRLIPKAGKDSWKDEATFKPSAAVGFYIEVAPGDQPYEFRLNGGGKQGGAVFVIDAAKSTRPLPANAPVVAIPGAPLVASATPVPGATATPAATEVPAGTPAPDATPAPTPRPATPDGAPRAFALWLGASQGEQTRTFVTGSAPASDFAIGMRWQPIASAQVWLGGALESTKDLVPLPLAPVTRISERRVTVDVGAGYRLSGAGASLVAGPSLRYASFDNDEVGYDWMMASLAGRVEVPAGPVTGFAGGEAGVPVSDGTPGGWEDGDLQNRYAWSAGARYTHGSLPTSPSVAVEYRGEHVGRRYSELDSHGMRLVLQVEL